MLIDPFGRAITYLRISVTDKCNFRCTYCMPPEGVPLKPHAEMLRYEEIARVVNAAAELGIRKVRLTGGEPLVKRNIEYLVGIIANTPGIAETCMTTNGSLLTLPKARALKKAGLSRVNISLDTLDPDRFAEITRGGSLEQVLSGIEAACAAGLGPVKINMLLFATTEPSEVERMRRFCSGRGLRLQTIGHFSLWERRCGHGLAADRPSSCERCNRLRLTADGYLKPCLFSDEEIRVDLGAPHHAILRAARAKPSSGSSCTNRHMSQIGG